jgi:type IV pilus assembly protein PilZ
LYDENSRPAAAGLKHKVAEGGPMVREKRLMPRIETSLEIAFRNTGVFMCSYMLNLNSGGMFIKTDQPLPVDAELEMRIQLPDDPDIMRVGGRVVWTKSESHAYPAGMGIQFIGMPPVYKEKIQSFVRNNCWKGNEKELSQRAAVIPA